MNSGFTRKRGPADRNQRVALQDDRKRNGSAIQNLTVNVYQGAIVGSGTSDLTLAIPGSGERQANQGASGLSTYASVNYAHLHRSRCAPDIDRKRGRHHGPIKSIGSGVFRRTSKRRKCSLRSAGPRAHGQTETQPSQTRCLAVWQKAALAHIQRAGCCGLGQQEKFKKCVFCMSCMVSRAAVWKTV